MAIAGFHGYQENLDPIAGFSTAVGGVGGKYGFVQGECPLLIIDRDRKVDEKSS